MQFSEVAASVAITLAHVSGPFNAPQAEQLKHNAQARRWRWTAEFITSRH